MHSILPAIALTLGLLPQAPATRTSPSPWISVRALRGADVVLGGEGASARKGRLQEVVVSSRDGRIAHYMLSVGEIVGGPEKIVLVPAADLKITIEEEIPRATLRSTEARLRSQPAFNLAKARKDGVDAALAEGGTPGASGEGEAAALRDNTIPQYLFSTDLEGVRVRTGEELFGRVGDAAIDVRSGAIAYLLVLPRATPGGVAGGIDGALIVPFAACRFIEGEKGTLLGVERTAAELGKAPRYERPSRGFLSLEQAKRADSFFAAVPVGQG
jgi:sporulation protein YlmC with PRC-barrel domain